MLILAESIVDGTWVDNGTPQPEEWVDFALMKQMRWTWDELEATPPYVRAYCCAFLGAIARQEKSEMERAKSG